MALAVINAAINIVLILTNYNNSNINTSNPNQRYVMRNNLEALTETLANITTMRSTIANENTRLLFIVNQLISSLNTMINRSEATPEAAANVFNKLRNLVSPQSTAPEAAVTPAQKRTLTEALQTLTYETDLDPSEHVEEDGIPAAPPVAPMLRRQ